MGTEIRSLKSDLGGGKLFKEYMGLAIRGAQTLLSSIVCGTTSLFGAVGTYVAFAPSTAHLADGALPLITGLPLVGVASGFLTYFLGKSIYKKHIWLSQKFDGENILSYFQRDLEGRGQKMELFESNRNLENRISLTLPGIDVLRMSGFEKYDGKEGEPPSFRQKSHHSSSQDGFLSGNERVRGEIVSRVLKPYSSLDEKDWETYHKVVESKLREHSTSILKLVGIAEDIYRFLEKEERKKDYSEAFYEICMNHRMRKDRDYDKELIPETA